MLALKWFSTYFIEIFTFLVLNSFKMKKFQKINFYLFLNIYFNLYKETSISKNFTKYFLSNTNDFNMFLYIYLIWTSFCLLKGKNNWFLLLLLLNSKNHKFKINLVGDFSSNFVKNNPFNLIITKKLHFLKKNFFKNFNEIKFEKFLSYKFTMFPIKFKPSNILFFLSQSTFKKLNINFIRNMRVFHTSYLSGVFHGPSYFQRSWRPLHSTCTHMASHQCVCACGPSSSLSPRKPYCSFLWRTWKIWGLSEPPLNGGLVYYVLWTAWHNLEKCMELKSFRSGIFRDSLGAVSTWTLSRNVRR